MNETMSHAPTGATKTVIFARESDRHPNRMVSMDGTPEWSKHAWMKWYPQGKVVRIVREDKNWYRILRPTVG